VVQVPTDNFQLMNVIDGVELDVNATRGYSRLSEWREAMGRVSTTQLSLSHSYQVELQSR
jgi:hypothetical protein